MNKIKKVVIVGGGGTTGDVIALIESINQSNKSYKILGILDDSKSKGDVLFDYPILGTIRDNVYLDQDIYFIDCLGSTRSYQKRQSIFQNANFDLDRFLTIIHPSAFISNTAKIGIGSIIYPNVVVLSNVEIGSHVTILSNSVLNHDVFIGDWSIIASGVMLSGAVKIGSTCYLGSASSFRETIKVGSGCLVGMGSVVIKDVPKDKVIAGVPAKTLKDIT